MKKKKNELCDILNDNNDSNNYRDDWEKIMINIYKKDPELALNALKIEFDEYKKTKDPTYFMSELGKISKAYGIKKLEKKSKISRKTLYDIFSCKHKPSFEYLNCIIDALGFNFKLV